MSPPPPAEGLPADGRVTLVLTSPRSAPGVLTWPGWERLRSADRVLAADPDPIWRRAFEQAQILVEDVVGLGIGERAGRLVQEAAEGRELVWWGSPDGDPGLTDALAEHLSRRAVAGRPPEVEVLTASHDVPGARLLDLVAVMDTLRSPGGCPWDAEQTHSSLLPYLLEETHEVIEAIEARDRDHLVEELGDLLLQVVFHARVGQEHESAPFDIDEVAAGIVAKLVRRHPHVFGAQPTAADTPPIGHAASQAAPLEGGHGASQAPPDPSGSSPTVAEVELNWETLKAAEKPRRQTFEGIPATLPALARAQKMLGRLERLPRSGAGDLPSDPQTAIQTAIRVAADGDQLAETLLQAVRSARADGVDAEAQLRAALARMPTT